MSQTSTVERDRDAEHKHNTTMAQLLIASQEAWYRQAIKDYIEEHYAEPCDILRESIRDNAYASAAINFDVMRWTRPISNSLAECRDFLIPHIEAGGKLAMAEQLRGTSSRRYVHLAAYDVARDLLWKHAAPIHISAALTGPENTLYWQCIAIMHQFPKKD